MSDIRNSILATIVYYDILDFPLTMFEVHKYLINPERIREGPQRVPDSYGINPERLSGDFFSEIISLGQVAKELEGLVADNLISSKNGFYFLSDRYDLYELRIDREKIAAQKWKKFLRIAKWFQAVPYLRAILASGSLAINNTDKESDFDVLSVVRSDRLYTCRIFLCLVASLFRARRTRSDIVAPDKFCFNHYITDKNMNIKYESLYNAQAYAYLKPVLVSDGIFNRFYAENVWLKKYIHNFIPEDKFILRSVIPSPVLVGIGRLGEFILNSPLGDKIEDWAKKYQQKRIKENPVTYESGGRVVFTDNELEFHPHSFESFAIDKYNRGLKQLGIIPPSEEKDSGLTV